MTQKRRSPIAVKTKPTMCQPSLSEDLNSNSPSTNRAKVETISQAPPRAPEQTITGNWEQSMIPLQVIAPQLFPQSSNNNFPGAFIYGSPTVVYQSPFQSPLPNPIVDPFTGKLVSGSHLMTPSRNPFFL